jgi:uncharacterized Zn-binding protein involved in type VI secretion
MYVSTVAKGQTFAMPDVCLTPTPAGSIPIPYPNIGKLSAAKKRTTKIFVSGAAALTKVSIIKTTTGDEAGVNKGIVSKKTKGKVEFTTASKKVKFQGKPALRMMDKFKANNKNAMGAILQSSQTKVDAG